MEIRSLPTGIMVYITIKKRRMTGAEDAIHAGKRATHAKTLAFSKFCDSFWVKMEGNRKSQKFEIKELFGMKKKMISLALALVMCLTLCIPAFASESMLRENAVVPSGYS